MPLVKAVQEIASIGDAFKTNLIAWLGNASNGIADLYATAVHATTGSFQQVCFADGPSDQSPLCVTKTQLAALLSQSASADLANPSPASPGTSLANPSPTAASTGSPSPFDNTASSSPTSTPPVIQINGDNPAYINIGDTYNDLGATITGPQADLSRHHRLPRKLKPRYHSR